MWLVLLTKYWQYGVIALLFSGLLLTSWEWRHTDAEFHTEQAAHAADIASFKNAQADANKLAQKERDALQAQGKANAAKADSDYSSLLTKYHASILRYQTNSSGSQGSDYNQLQSTESGNGPSSSADLPATLTITGSDAQVCAVNTARLQAVHDWAISLPQEGTK